MKRRHWITLGGGLSLIVVVAILRLIVGNGVIWHFIPWHL